MRCDYCIVAPGFTCPVCHEVVPPNAPERPPLRVINPNPDPVLAETCGNCRFWTVKPWSDKTAGDCRKLAPAHGDGYNRRWPMTDREEGCGEFEPRATAST